MEIIVRIGKKESPYKIFSQPIAIEHSQDRCAWRVSRPKNRLGWFFRAKPYNNFLKFFVFDSNTINII
jgi:hypothetical protein